MSDIDERVAKRREEEEALRQRLADANLDGPHHFPDGVLGFLGARNKFAVCLTCGAMVLLNDHAQNDEGGYYERSATLHMRWHAED